LNRQSRWRHRLSMMAWSSAKVTTGVVIIIKPSLDGCGQMARRGQLTIRTDPAQLVLVTQAVFLLRD
jgi:hypothetical protein